MKLSAALLLLLLTGCVPYSDFTLPKQPGGPQPRWALNLSANPVIVRGGSGSFDSVDALNPSVIRRGTTLWNLFSGYDGKTWHTGLATSADGELWEKKGKVLSPNPATWEGDYIAANGSLVEKNGQLLYFYQGGKLPQMGLARSADGINWTKQPGPVLPPGPIGSWDERGVADPYVISVDGTLYLYFLGQDRARRQRLGVAISTDDGLHWKKLRTNPILELGDPGAFDEIGLGEPAVWASHGYYWMLYTGRDKAEHRRMGLASSQDGVSWTRSTGSPFEGAAAWNHDVVCDATVLVEGGKVRIWYGGGNRPQPAEGLNGQIGTAVLEASR
jgi:predicted GH43/DUF377 family glycosyl hydrolase